MSVLKREIADEHDLYPVHEDDDLPERPAHEKRVRYLRSVLETRLPERWVTGDVCMYWEERAFHRYVAPDVLVAEGPPHQHDVFLSWTDGRALLVIEVGSKTTFREDEGPKVDRYLLDLGVEEYLYFKPHRQARRRSLQMWRLQGEDVVEVVVRDGRVRSLAVGLEFGPDETGFLQAYQPDGPSLLSLEEEHARAEAALALAEQERLRATALEKELERLREALRQHGSGDTR